MGHIHLGVLPRCAKWRDVVRLLELQAEDDDVIAASAVAAENEFARAASDPAFVEAIRLLALIPQAANGANFTSGLRDIGIKVSNSPLLMDLIVATGAAFDAYAIKIMLGATLVNCRGARFWTPFLVRSVWVCRRCLHRMLATSSWQPQSWPILDISRQ